MSRTAPSGHAALAAALALAVAACGSRGPVEPAALVQPRDALRLGMQSYHDHQYLAAQQLFSKAYVLYRSVDDGRGQVSALINMADTALALGEHAQALAHILDAERLAARDELGGFDSRLDLLKAQALLAAGSPAAARVLLDGVLARSGGEPALRQAAVLERARLAQASGDDAQAWLERARAELGGSPAPSAQASLLRLEAASLQSGGDHAGARLRLAEALELYRREFYRPGIAAVHEDLGALARKHQELAPARDHYERALAIRLWLNDRAHSAAVLTALAAIEESAGAPARARRLRELRAHLTGAGNTEWRLVQMKYEQLDR